MLEPKQIYVGFSAAEIRCSGEMNEKSRRGQRRITRCVIPESAGRRISGNFFLDPRQKLWK